MQVFDGSLAVVTVMATILNLKGKKKKVLSLVVSTEFFEIETSIWFTFLFF